MVSSKLTRRAFTLLELIVCLAIIGIFISLLLSGVQSIRRSESQLQTVNRFHQLGLGMHSYLNANRNIMPGYYFDRTPYSTDPRGSWSCPIEVILPHVDSKSKVSIGAGTYFRAVVNPNDPSFYQQDLPFISSEDSLPEEFTSCVVNRLLFVSLRAFPECAAPEAQVQLQQ
jgi:prepilin-type N-terminal cleavage/methylation domain-containing protein